MSAGGKERQIIELLKGIKKNRRFKTVLGVFNRGGKLEADALELADITLEVPFHNKGNVVSPIYSLIKQARVIKVDLIHTFGSAFWDLAGLVCAKVVGVPNIYGGIRSAPPVMSTQNKISRWIGLNSTAIVANSKAGLDAYNLLKHTRSKVIYNGVDLSRFIGIKPEPINYSTICMVANFSKKKDHLTLIRAFSSVKEIFPETTLTLVGHDYGTLENCRRFVAETGLSESVKFVTDTIHPAPYIAGSRVCILTTNHNVGEGLSNAILEYMALSKPVIATNCGGNIEVVEDGKTGYLVPGLSSESISRSLIKLLRQPDLAKHMGEMGRQRLVNKFSLEKMVSKYEQLYYDLLKMKIRL